MHKGKFKAKMFGSVSSGHLSIAAGACQKIIEMGFGHSSGYTFVSSFEPEKNRLKNWFFLLPDMVFCGRFP